MMTTLSMMTNLQPTFARGCLELRVLIRSRRGASGSTRAKAAVRSIGTGSPIRELDLIRHCRIMLMFSFIETRLFTKLVLGYLTDDEYLALQTALMSDPEAGPVMPGSGGVRKLRWGAPGRGKRGGYRVIYYVRRAHGVIWMLTMYPKNVADNIPTHVLRQIRKEVEDG